MFFCLFLVILEQKAWHGKVVPGVYLHFTCQSTSLNVSLFWFKKRILPRSSIWFLSSHRLDRYSWKPKTNFPGQLIIYAFWVSRKFFWFSRLALKMTGILENKDNFYSAFNTTQVFCFARLVFKAKLLNKVVTWPFPML